MGTLVLQCHPNKCNYGTNKSNMGSSPVVIVAVSDSIAVFILGLCSQISEQTGGRLKEEA